MNARIGGPCDGGRKGVRSLCEGVARSLADDDGLRAIDRKPKLGMIQPKMGNSSIPPTTHGLGSALFSGTQQRVLALLFGQPARSFYASELIALIGKGSGSVQRELVKLAQAGLVTMQSIGSQKHYQANAASPIFAEVRGIVQKTFGLSDPLRASLAPFADGINAAFVYGSVAKQADTAESDVDLMIISEAMSYGDVFLALDQVSSDLGRTINPTILTRHELAKRIKAKEAFITRVLAQPKLWLIGDERAIAA